jgi:hypothetical protein
MGRDVDNIFRLFVEFLIVGVAALDSYFVDLYSCFVDLCDFFNSTLKEGEVKTLL